MLTIFAIPKPFSGHIGMIQRNAVRSMLALGPDAEVILVGDDPGVAEAASDLHVKHIPSVERSRFGTPTVSSAFEKAQAAAQGSIMVFANCDLIITSDIIEVARSVPFREFLVSGQSWELNMQSELDFAADDWESALRIRIASEGVLRPRTAMDWFAFPRGMYRDLPPFGIGRARWDNWLVSSTRARRIPVIDATAVMTAIHQTHDYSHLASGMQGAYEGPEMDWNLKLAGGEDYAFTLEDADWIMDGSGLHRTPLSLWSLKRKIRGLPVLHPTTAPVLKPLFALARSARDLFR